MSAACSVFIQTGYAKAKMKKDVQDDERGNETEQMVDHSEMRTMPETVHPHLPKSDVHSRTDHGY